MADDRRLHQIVKFLGLKDTSVHHQVEEDKEDRNEEKPNGKVWIEGTHQQNLRQYI